MHKNILKSLVVFGFVISGFGVATVEAQAATYTVRSGDTLARLFPSNWQAVASKYGINANLIYPGQVFSDDGVGGTRVAGVSTYTKPSQNLVGTYRSVPTYLAVGKPYVWGAEGPYAFDCSGLTRYLAAQMGLSVVGNSYSQMNGLRAISYGEMLPGDIIVMNGGNHVGTYLGNGQLIHALNPSQGVQIQGVSYVAQWNPIVGYRAVGH